MAKVLVCCCLLLTIACGIKAWSYDVQDQWSNDYPACGLTKQSPIAINTKDLVTEKYPAIKYVKYNKLYNAKLTNNGHSAQLVIPGKILMPKISGGPLPKGEKYEFVNLHFHWGSNNDVGSEHTIDEKRHAVEIHGVHYNVKYGNLEEALKHEDGVAVLSAFYDTSLEQKLPGLQAISNALSKIVTPGTSVDIPKFKLSALYGGMDVSSKHVFYSYSGSLTTPPCAEAVTWIIFPKPVAVATAQLEPFRQLMDEHGQVLVNNYRNVQDMNGRDVHYSKS
uniref:carbonic anhydrase n=2 Tax=Haematobia irritans TaxID=7368 RepID=A0A1L8EG56_HAEIR